MLANALLPLLAGACVYVISSPNVVFVRFINLQMNTASAFITPDVWWWSVFRNHALDMFWGYSLVFAVCLIMDNSAAGWRLLLLTFVFSMSLEVLQLFPAIPGTFDLLDIFAEGIAELLATIIINRILPAFVTE